MSSYIYSGYSYACSFVWTPAPEVPATPAKKAPVKRAAKTPAKKIATPAEVTLKQNQAVYQELFSRLLTMNSLLYRKDYSAFKEHWTHLKNYEGVWTTDMRKHLDPLLDGQFFNVWFNPDYTFPICVLQSKLEGCIDVTRPLAEVAVI